MHRSRMLWIAVLVGVCFFGGLAITGATLAADVLQAIKERGKIIVGTSADYPPYESVDKDGNFVGFDMDMIREIGKRMGQKVEIKDMAFDGLIAALQAGKIDVIVAAMQATPERDKMIDFSMNYHEMKDAFLVKADSKITMKSPMDAAGHTIAVQTGTIQEQWVGKNLIDPGKLKKEQLSSYERVDNAAMDVAAGRVEMLFIVSDPAKKLAEKMGLKIALVTSETVIAGQSIALPEGAASFKAELDRIITEMKQDGTMKAMMDKWGLL